jgi:hypothetical protein
MIGHRGFEANGATQAGAARRRIALSFCYSVCDLGIDAGYRSANVCCQAG